MHSRQRAVLELAAVDALAASVGDLSELEGSLQGDRVGEAVAEVLLRHTEAQWDRGSASQDLHG